MPNYEEMYYSLFAAICEAIEEIDTANYGKAKEILIKAHQKAEDMYIEAGESE